MEGGREGEREGRREREGGHGLSGHNSDFVGQSNPEME